MQSYTHEGTLCISKINAYNVCWKTNHKYVSSTSAVLFTDLSLASGEAIVLVAFGAHFFKDIACNQLESAAKSLLSQKDRKHLLKAEKNKFIQPLAKAFVEQRIVKISEGSKMSSLTRNNLEKIGKF